MTTMPIKPGDRVRGTYRGREFEGVVTSQDSTGYTIIKTIMIGRIGIRPDISHAIEVVVR